MKQKLQHFAHPPHHSTLATVIKFTLAFVIGWGLTFVIPQSRSQWIMISIAVVMGSSIIIGLQFTKAILRVLGTIIGASFGLLTFIMPNNPYLLLTAICLAAIFFSWFSQTFQKHNYVSSLGMITFFIIAYSSNHSLSMAGLRLLDTLIGILISLFISRFIFPVTSQSAILRLTDSIAKDMANFARKIFIERLERRNNKYLLHLDSRITDAMLKQRSIIDALLFNSNQTQNIKKSTFSLLRFTRAIYHYLLFIDTALWENRLEKAEHGESMHKAIMPYMTTLSTLLQQPFNHEKPMETISTLNQNMQTFMHQSKIETLGPNEIERQHAILFALRRIIFCIQKVELAKHELYSC